MSQSIKPIKISNFKIKILATDIFWQSLLLAFQQQVVKNPPEVQEIQVPFLGWKIPWERDKLPIPVLLGFPCDSAGKESTCNAGDLCLVPGPGRSPGEGKGYPLQYFGLENSMEKSMGSKESDTTEWSSLSISLYAIDTNFYICWLILHFKHSMF